MPSPGFRVERIDHHYMWEVIFDDGRRRHATPEERKLWDRLCEHDLGLWLAGLNLSIDLSGWRLAEPTPTETPHCCG